MRKIVLLLLTVIMFTGRAVADEGMWLLPYIQKLNIKQMKSLGLKLEAEDIYSANQSSIKDAIAIFGGGCTSELISSQGLLLTNHHCGYGAIQQHSSVESDYLRDGFWAMSFQEEIPTPGLKATFIRQIIDVSDQIIPMLNAKMSEAERAEKVALLSKQIIKDTPLTEKGTTAEIESFFGGNQYILFVKQVFNDVRMVGAPPTAIGKFGGDTDNWMWPRHTGDFAIFRVYTDKDGNPADYSADNIPYKPKKWLPISLGGIKEGDYAMIIGFPGRTNRYMTSYEIDETVNQNNPNRIKIRGIRQDILIEQMKANQQINIMYASKYAGSSNYWKNSIGMNKGLKKLNVKADKESIEDRFTEWVSKDKNRQKKYGEALSLIKQAVEGRMPYNNVNQYISETLLRGTELITIAGRFDRFFSDKVKNGVLTDSLREELKKISDDFYKDYSVDLDKKVAIAMVNLFLNDISKKDYPDIFSEALQQTDGDIDMAINKLYASSMFADKSSVDRFISSSNNSDLENDHAIQAFRSIFRKSNELKAAAKQFDEMFARGHRLFIEGLIEMDKSKVYYPDANFTMRLTYGQVLPYKPADAVTYGIKTTLSGVIAKEDPQNAYEFTVPQKLKELYKSKDFGNYAEDGDVPVAFIANNDITGGNSGSPVINGKGELIGTAFDGNWEAMSGDIAFEPLLQRSINVDIRYTLFIIEKLGGAKRLIDEMTIVK